MEQKRLPVFAERFALLRGEMTQKEFADFLGIARPTVGFYENGTRLPDARILRQIAEKCEVSSDWLLGLSDIKNTDGDVKQSSNFTGLSASSVETLHYLKQEELEMFSIPVFIFINEFLSNPDDAADFGADLWRSKCYKAPIKDKLSDEQQFILFNMLLDPLDDELLQHKNRDPTNGAFKLTVEVPADVAEQVYKDRARKQIVQTFDCACSKYEREKEEDT